MRINGFNIINLKPGCRSSLSQHVFTSGIEIEENIILKQNNLSLHLKDLIQVQEYEENEFLELIKEEQENTKKPVDIVDVRKKFHLKQLAKKSKINTIFGSTTSIITLAVLVIGGIILYKICMKKSRQPSKIINHFNRMEEHGIVREEPISMKLIQGEAMSSRPAQGEANMSARPAKSEASIDSVSTDNTEIKGPPINLSEIMQKID